MLPPEGHVKCAGKMLRLTEFDWGRVVIERYCADRCIRCAYAAWHPRLVWSGRIEDSMMLFNFGKPSCFQIEPANIHILDRQAAPNRSEHLGEFVHVESP